MTKLASLLIPLMAVTILSGCGNLRGPQNSMYAAGYEYVFAAGQPFEISGDLLNDPEGLAMANELLDGRTFEFSPPISIRTAPGWDSDTTLLGGRVSSPIGYDGLNLLFWEVGAKELYYGGFANVESGEMTITLTHDVVGGAKPVRLEYVFDVDEAQALVNGLRDWRSNGLERTKESMDSFEANVKLSGMQDGLPWELVCKQAITCFAVHWEAD